MGRWWKYCCSSEEAARQIFDRTLKCFQDFCQQDKTENTCDISHVLMMTFLVKCLIPGGKNESHFTLSFLCLPIPIRCKKTLARMSEKFCVQWNDYSDSVKEGFKTLKTNSDFSDVTLACEDGQQIDAHKVVLVSTSPFFHNLLKRNNHPHPLIYM